jgi:hypothetical protein
MSLSRQGALTVGAAASAAAVLLFFFHAPTVPVVVGTLGAVLVLIARARRG